MKKMKTVVRILTSYVLCAALCFSVAACGSKDDNGGSGSESSALQKYIDDNKEQLDELESAMASSGMNLAVEVDGNTLVYKYQYTEDLGDDAAVDSVKEALATSMDAASSTFESLLTQLKSEVSEAEGIKVIYNDKDGNELYSKEFK